MSTQPVSHTQTKIYPWHEREVVYMVKLAAALGVFIVGYFALLIGLMAFASVGLTLALPPDQLLPTLFTSNLLPLAASAVGLFLTIKLWRIARSPTRARVAFRVAPTALGQPFAVQFRRHRFARTLNGKGVVRFEDNHLFLEGTLEPSVAFQVGVIVMVTVVPLIVFKIGLGLIPALLLAYALGRQKIAHAIACQDIRDPVVKGCTVFARCPGESPAVVKFRVASSDGERLYRERLRHYPQAVGGWAELLELPLADSPAA